MVFQYTGALPNSKSAHEGSETSFISSTGAAATAAVALIPFLLILIILLAFTECLRIGDPLKLLPLMHGRDAPSLEGGEERLAEPRARSFENVKLVADVAAIRNPPLVLLLLTLALVSNGLSDAHDYEKRREILPPAASVSGSVPEISYTNGHRIWFSDVIVDRPKRLFGGRKWNSLDIGTASVVVIMHLISIFAPFTFNWNAFRVAVALYFATGLLGICLSFHRNLSHRSFRLPKWLEYFCAYCGVLALQGNPIDWVSTHRYHHQYCDSSKDPHSPIEGFWFSHMNWLFDTDAVIDRCGEASNVLDLEKQGFYRFIRSTYIFHPLALGVLLYALGGIPYIVWGMGVRTIWVYHITWLVNSACHVWGTQSWNTGDLSTNNWWVALLSFGEGWHNNHHAFEYSARHGLQWWEIDMTWYTVRLLQLIGFAKDVKLPTDAHRKRMAFGSNSECIAG